MGHVELASVIHDEGDTLGRPAVAAMTEINWEILLTQRRIDTWAGTSA